LNLCSKDLIINEKSFSDLETLLGKAYSILAMNEIKGSQNDELFVDILFKKNL
jgi:hypothetical protein